MIVTQVTFAAMGADGVGYDALGYDMDGLA